MQDTLNILITGGSRGIGLEIVKLLAQRRHNLFVVTRNIDPVMAYAKIEKLANIKAIPFDLSGNDFAPIVNALGNSKIDIVINNAGLLINKTFSDLTPEEFELQYKVNVFGVFRLLKAVDARLKNEKSSICNITSMGGINGTSKFPGLSGYSSSKGALSILTECLAEEFKERGINVNGLALGAVQTEMLNEAFPGYVSQVSASSMAGYIVEFVLNQSCLFNGKIISVSNSTP